MMVDVVGVVLEQMMVVVVAMLVAEKLRNILIIFPPWIFAAKFRMNCDSN